MNRRLLVFLSALATVLAVIPAATAGTGTLVAQAQDRGGAASLTEVSGAITAGSSIHVDAELMKSSESVPIIIKLDEQPVASYEGGVAGFAATSPRVNGADKLDVDSPSVQSYQTYLADKHADFERSLTAAVDGAVVNYSYEYVVGGVSAIVPGSSIATIAKMNDVEAIFEDTLNQLDTEVSPQFIGADVIWDALGGQDVAGEGVIVANVDSGIWPEHPSVSDPDPAGNAYPAPPAHWAGSGVGAGCDFGNVAFNPNDAPFTCNNKLLGAYDFTATYTAVIGLIPTEFASARDSNGHGSHTLTTSGGNGGVEAEIFDIQRGTVSGVAPRAHVVAYKGCGLQGCFSSDTSAAIDQATADGVDVLNYSISGGGSPYTDVVSLAMLDAYNGGTLVTPSAGNSGPGPDTVAHREPWTLTVGASTTDRHFLTTITLTADDGETLELVGATVTDGIADATPVIFPPTGFEQCDNDPATPGADPFPAGTFDGEIVICDRGGFARVLKSYDVAQGGAGGMFLTNLVSQGLNTDNHFVPSAHLENDTGDELKAFVASHTGVMATFSEGEASAVQGDVMAPFSSRGGSAQTLGISKPDITAPGVQILAAMTPEPENVQGGVPNQLFQSIQGTSMSAPHAAGSAALVKALHPDWTPGQIKSALMMTATQDVTKEGGVPAGPYDFGSGRVDLTVAGDANVAISETAANFVALEDTLWDANYPSLYVPVFTGQLIVERTFENMTDEKQRYEFEIMKPDDLRVVFGFYNANGKFKKKKNGKTFVAAGGTRTHAIKVDGRDLDIGETRHAWIKFTNRDSDETLMFPITVVRQQGDVSLDKTCEPSTIALGGSTSCTITVQNNTFDSQSIRVADKPPSELELDESSVVGATKIKTNGTIRLNVNDLAGAVPPAPSVVIDPLASPAGYLALAGFPGTIDVGATDESIANFTVPSFNYAGESYDTIGIVSNGYVVVGGGSGADVDFINTDLPNPAVPNNVLAPFWTDLNPEFGGAVLVNVLTDGTDTWTVVEWESVANFGDLETNTFQIWLGSDTDPNPGEDISFTYGVDISDGDSGFLTVGVENDFGNEGGTIYFDGVGTLPAPSFPNGDFEIDVVSIPGAPGEIRVVTYDAEGVEVGNWTNYVKMWSSGFPGKAWANTSGAVSGGGGG